MNIKIINFTKKKEFCFSTIELIVSISIIVILGSMFLLNYGFQRDRMALDNAVNATVQSIRKVQGLALGQLAKPAGTTEPEGNTSCSDSDIVESATNFAILFKEEENKVHLVADKDIPDKEECYFETRYFSSSIKIDSINPTTTTDNSGWVSFDRENLAVKINNNDLNKTLTVTLCIKSSCSANKKTIIINKVGMVEVQ